MDHLAVLKVAEAMVSVLQGATIMEVRKRAAEAFDNGDEAGLVHYPKSGSIPPVPAGCGVKSTSGGQPKSSLIAIVRMLLQQLCGPITP
jgi:hypothetical protein